MNPIRELTLWAKYRSYAEGKGLSLSPPQEGSASRDRPDWVNDKHSELWLGLCAHATLQAMRTYKPKGRMYSRVLYETFVVRDKAGRKQTLLPGTKEANELFEFVGLLVSKPKVKKRYHRVSGLDKEVIRKRGEKILRESLLSYCAVRAQLFRKNSLPNRQRCV